VVWIHPGSPGWGFRPALGLINTGGGGASFLDPVDYFGKGGEPIFLIFLASEREGLPCKHSSVKTEEGRRIRFFALVDLRRCFRKSSPV